MQESVDMGRHMRRTLEFLEITQSENCNSITGQPQQRRYLQVGVLENILRRIFVGFRVDSPYKGVTLVRRNLPLRQRLFILQQTLTHI